jgi:hypothetical protein
MPEQETTVIEQSTNGVQRPAPEAPEPGVGPMTESRRKDILRNERPLLQGVLAAARQVKTRTMHIEIARPDETSDTDEEVVVLEFDVNGLTDKQRETAQREFMEYTETPSGMVMPDMRRTSAANQRALQIYTATVDKSIWEDPRTQETLYSEGLIDAGDYKNLNKYVRAVATIQACLYAPEIDRVINLIETLGARSQRVEGVAKRPS